MTRDEKLLRAGLLVSQATRLVEDALGDDGWTALVNLAAAATDIARAREGIIEVVDIVPFAAEVA